MAMRTTLHLILIPGLGDRKWLYKLVCPVWRARGFRVHVFTFGWEDAASNYHDKQNHLNNYIRDLNVDVYIIGASAGGVAALSALMVVDDGKVKGVTTIATPYVYRRRLKNETLARAIDELSNNLPAMQAKLVRVTSFYGMRDQVVPPIDSQPNDSELADVNCQQLPTFGHGLTIAAGLTIFGGRITRSWGNETPKKDTFLS